MSSLSEDIPTGEDGKPKILLGVGVDDDGFLYLYDRLTGREVAMMDGISVETSNDDSDIQRVDIGVQTDPRLVDSEAIGKIRNGKGGWTVTEWLDTKN